MSFNSRLDDIIENGGFILEHKLSYEKSRMGKYGIERALMIIGEAMKVLSNKYKVNWDDHKQMIQMGDYIDHQYIGLNPAIVTKTIEYDLPELIKLAKKLKK